TALGQPLALDARAFHGFGGFFGGEVGQRDRTYESADRVLLQKRRQQIETARGLAAGAGLASGVAVGRLEIARSPQHCSIPTLTRGICLAKKSADLLGWKFRPGGGSSMQRMARLVAFVALVTVPSLADARKPEDVYAGKILFLKQRLPEHFRSSEDMISTLK